MIKKVIKSFIQLAPGVISYFLIKNGKESMDCLEVQRKMRNDKKPTKLKLEHENIKDASLSLRKNLKSCLHCSFYVL